MKTSDILDSNLFNYWKNLHLKISSLLGGFIINERRSTPIFKVDMLRHRYPFSRRALSE